MEKLVITEVFTAESIRNNGTEDWELSQTTGKSLAELKAELEGKPLFNMPEIPMGWAAWSAVTATGQVGVYLCPVWGPLGNRLTQVLIVLQEHFKDMLPKNMASLKGEIKRVGQKKFREMCPKW